MNGKSVSVVFAGLIILGSIGEGANYFRHEAFTVAATQPGGPSAPHGVISPSPLPTVCPTTSKPGTFVAPCPQASANSKLRIRGRIPRPHINGRQRRLNRVLHPIRYYGFRFGR